MRKRYGENFDQTQLHNYRYIIQCSLVWHSIHRRNQGVFYPLHCFQQLTQTLRYTGCQYTNIRLLRGKENISETFDYLP